MNMLSRPVTQGATARASTKRGVSSPSAIVFDTSDRRFKMKGLDTYIHQRGTTQNVGPGSYNHRDNSMMKKSFNMSMEQSHFI